MLPGRLSRPLSSLPSRVCFLNATRAFQKRKSLRRVQRAATKVSLAVDKTLQDRPADEMLKVAESTVASSTRAPPLAAPAPKRRRISLVDGWGEYEMSEYPGGREENGNGVVNKEELVGDWRPYSSRWRDLAHSQGNNVQDKEAGSAQNGNSRNKLRSSKRLNPGASYEDDYQGSYAQPIPYAQDTPNWTWPQQNQVDAGKLDAQPADTYGNAMEQPFSQPQFPFQPGFNPFNFPMWNSPFGMNNAHMLPFMPPTFPSNGFFPNFGVPASARGFSTFPLMPCGYDGTSDGLSDPTQLPNERSHSKSPPAPHPTPEYLQQASSPARELPSPQPLLLVLDLNGTLIHRTSKKQPPKFVRRAKLNEFLDTLVKAPKKYKILIWSSSQPHNVKGICEQLFLGDRRKQLVGEWGRDKFGLTGLQYSSKIQVYKRLETVWGDWRVQASYPGASPEQDETDPERHWNQTNTVLIDDSKLKALSEPYNILEIPEFTNAKGVDENWIFPSLIRSLETLAKYDDVSKVIRGWTLQTEGSPFGAKDKTTNGAATQLESLSPSPPSSPELPGGKVENHPSHAYPHLQYTTEDPIADRKAARKANKKAKKGSKAEAKAAAKAAEQAENQRVSSAAGAGAIAPNKQGKKKKRGKKKKANSNPNPTPGMDLGTDGTLDMPEMQAAQHQHQHQHQPQGQSAEQIGFPEPEIYKPKQQTRNQIRKAQKAHGKARREARARAETEAEADQANVGDQAETAAIRPGAARASQSPARSENYLLDRLEESLNS